MKFTEGAFRDWGYALATRRVRRHVAVGWDDCGGKPPAGQVLVKDAIADITLQQVLTRPDEFDVIATTEPERRLPLRRARRAGRRHRHRARRQHQLRHRPRASSRRRTAPRRSTPNQDKVNPGSVILSGVMMLEHLGWTEAADAHHQRRSRRRIARQDRHLRLRPPDGGRHRGQVLRVRRRASSSNLLVVDPSAKRSPAHAPQEEDRTHRRRQHRRRAGRARRAQASSATSCCSTSPRRRASPRARRSTSSRTAPSSATTRPSPAPRNWADCAGADVVIVTAGVPRKPGMSRDDLARRSTSRSSATSPRT